MTDISRDDVPNSVKVAFYEAYKAGFEYASENYIEMFENASMPDSAAMIKAFNLCMETAFTEAEW